MEMKGPGVVAGRSCGISELERAGEITVVNMDGVVDPGENAAGAVVGSVVCTLFPEYEDVFPEEEEAVVDEEAVVS